MFDVPPPENDDEAFKLGKQIRQWIKNGKREPGESDEKEVDEDEDAQKQDEDQNPKKKRGRFGFLRK